MRLQDTMASREHKRTKESIRVKDSSAAKNAKLKLAQQRASAKQGPSKVPSKYPAKNKGTAKKLPAKKVPPKKKGR